MGRIFIRRTKNSSTRLNKKRLDEELDLHDGLSRKMEEYDGKSLYDSDDIDDDFDEYDSDLDDDHTMAADVDLYDDYDEDDEDDVLRSRELMVDLVDILRREIKKKEPYRDYLLFKYRGEICEGVPMAEVNAGKFIFKINDTMRAVVLSEIKVL